MVRVNPSDFSYMDGIRERSFAPLIWNRAVQTPSSLAQHRKRLLRGHRLDWWMPPSYDTYAHTGYNR